jgi:quinol monooxygenase YgiN
MILVVGTVRVPEDAFESAVPAMHAMIAETRKEDGCIHYAFARDLVDPGVMHVSEAWRDRDALKAHGASAHMREWQAAIGSVGVSERNLRLYDTDEGTPL